DHDEAGGRHYYRLRDRACLVKSLGLAEPFTYEPVMAEQFYLRFGSEEEMRRAEAVLARYHVKDPAVFRDERTRLLNATPKEGALMVQCRCTRQVPPDTRISAANDPSVSIPFFDVFYQTDTTKSGRHHPAGMLWVRHPERRHQVHAEKV